MKGLVSKLDKRICIVFVITVLFVVTSCIEVKAAEGDIKYEFEDSFRTVVLSNQSDSKIDIVRLNIYFEPEKKETFQNLYFEKDISFEPKEVKKITFTEEIPENYAVSEATVFFETLIPESENRAINDITTIFIVSVILFACLMFLIGAWIA